VLVSSTESHHCVQKQATRCKSLFVKDFQNQANLLALCSIDGLKPFVLDYVHFIQFVVNKGCVQ